ncbi:ATP-binding protein [Chryseobacterium sp. MMS23-Vi53]|uniref:tetratricopeptide repeat-containing sensor histidine kinase n=1 Tax=Chryseobacterium sp. MMS23-Vi53 TaxID=3386644 RepID=UPI0039EAECA5
MPAIKKIIFLFITFFTLSCREKKDNFYFEKIAPPKEEPTKVWLRKNENYNANKEHYLKIFLGYYHSKIAKSDYSDASKILDLVTTKFVYFYDFDPRLTKVVKEFDERYRSELPPIKTIYVDSYYGNLEFDRDNLNKAKDYFLKITALEPDDYKSCYKIARAYYDLSYTYFVLGDLKNSIEANEKSRNYSIKIRDQESIASVESNYVNIYKANGSFQKAIESADEVIKIYKETGNTYDYFMGKYNKCSVYVFFNKLRLKNKYIHETYKEYIASQYDNDILLLCISDYEIEALTEENKLNDAKIVLDKIKPVAEKNTSQNWQKDYQATLALYQVNRDVKTCNTKYIENSLPNLLEHKNYERANLFYSVLLEKAIQSRDLDKVVLYNNEVYRTKDSLSSAKNRLINLELAAKYETKEKEQEIKLQQKTIINKNVVIVALIFVFIALLLVIIIYYLKQKQKKLSLEKERSLQFTKNLLDKTEKERKRIASDLHDTVSHELLSLKHSFEVSQLQLNEKVDSIINDIRAISRNLHPVLFEKIGLEASLEQFIERIQNTHRFMITAEINYQNCLTTEKELQIYRIVQEAVSNIIKYADAIAAKVVLIENKDAIILEIIDNGKGFNVEETLKKKDAFGLHNMIERSKAIGGQARITSTDKGTKIMVQIKK